MNYPLLFARWADMPTDAETLADLSLWEFTPYDVDGKAVALLMRSGYEVHFAIDPAWRHRVITRDRARAFLAPFLDRLGFLVTRALVSSDAGRFLTGIGFVKTANRGEIDHYMLTRLPFEREG